MGGAKVGKSTLLARFHDSECYVEDYIPTVIDTIRQKMIIEDPTDGFKDREITLEIRDVGKQYWKEKIALGENGLKG